MARPANESSRRATHFAMQPSDLPSSGWQVLDHDREFLAREIGDFLPARIFDAHAHLCVTDHIHGHPPPFARPGTRTLFAKPSNARGSRA